MGAYRYAVEVKIEQIPSQLKQQSAVYAHQLANHPRYTLMELRKNFIDIFVSSLLGSASGAAIGLLAKEPALGCMYGAGLGAGDSLLHIISEFYLERGDNEWKLLPREEKRYKKALSRISDALSNVKNPSRIVSNGFGYGIVTTGLGIAVTAAGLGESSKLWFGLGMLYGGLRHCVKDQIMNYYLILSPVKREAAGLENIVN